MSENVIQSSFAAGELAPSIFARTDLAAYHTGLAKCRNFFVDYRSGVTRRPGTKFVIQCFKSSTAVRLIRFTFSVVTTYMIEFGDKYCRFVSNGAPVLETGFAISGMTNALPTVLTVVGNNFATGDWIFVTGVTGIPQINGRYFSVAVAGSSVTLFDVNGIPIDSRLWAAYTSGGTASRVYTITSPYAAADLALLKFTQSASVMTLTHPNYPPYNLTFNAPTNWVFSQIVFGSTISAPASASASSTGGTGTTTYYAYVVTAVDSSGQESIASPVATISAAGNIATAQGSNTITWSAVTGAVAYNVYKAEINTGAAVPAGAAFGFIGSATGLTFIDSNIVPDFSTTPSMTNQNPFASGNNPGCNCYFQQRAYYAASTSQPQTFWGSQPGAYNNFNVSDPVQADDAITGTIVSLEVNAIKWMLPMPGGLVLGTAKGAWTVSAGAGTNSTVAVTPLNATATPQAYNGASDVPPVVVNYDILYVQAKGAIIRDLSYNIYAAIYTGADISIRSNHLFLGHQIKEWAYSEEPYKIIWAVRDDGILLSLTFVKEQEIYGWAQHDTLGLYQSVSEITEGQVDAVYVIVKRFIGGRWVQMIERHMELDYPYGAEDAWSVDCGTRSTLPTPAAGLTASAPTGIVTFTADAGVFSIGDVGKVLRMGGGIATVTTYISPTQVIGTITQPISQTLPNDPNNTPVPAASGQWSLASPATTFYGLDYLAGQTVSILADGAVMPSQVVTVDGAITLPTAATKVVAGLGFQSQLQTMPLDVGEPTIQGKRKKIGALNVIVTNSRGLKAGRTFSTLVPIKEGSASISLGQAIPLTTGQERLVMDPLWNVPGQICMQIDDPLPSTVLGVVPEIVVGDSVR